MVSRYSVTCDRMGYITAAPDVHLISNNASVTLTVHGPIGFVITKIKDKEQVVHVQRRYLQRSKKSVFEREQETTVQGGKAM